MSTSKKKPKPMTTDSGHPDKGYTVIAHRELQNFLDLTAIKTLQYIKRSEHWIEAIFWIVLLLGGTALAIRDVRKVCEDYINEETYTSMSVKGRTNLTFEDAIICVEYDPRTLNLSSPQFIQYANASDHVVTLAERANMSAVEFLGRSLKLFTVISLIENGRKMDFREKVDEILTEEDLQPLQNWLKAQQVNIFDLGAAVGDWFCHAARIQITTLKRGNPLSHVNPCEQKNISWLGVIPFVDVSRSETTMCVDVGGKISFETMARIVVSVNTNGLFTREPPGNETTDFILDSFLDLSGDPVSTDMTKYFIPFPKRGCDAFEVGIDSELNLLDRRTARCTPEKSRLPCYAACDVQWYQRTPLCNCTQLAWEYLYDKQNERMCADTHTIQQHLDCRQAARNTSGSDACFNACLFPCTNRQHDISADTKSCYEKASGDGAVSIELTPKRFTVPIFTEHFSPSPPELFSRLGGTCGLWLGVGVLGLCHVALLPVKLVAKFVGYGLAKRGP